MRRTLAGLAAVATGIALMTATPAHGVPPVDVPIPAGPSDAEAGVDDLPNPAEQKRRALREAAVGGVLNGELTPVEINGSTVVNVGDTETAATADANGRRVQPTESEDQYVELEREQTDQVFVILAEFGNQRDPDTPDRDTDAGIPGPIRYDGPLHNQIPQPDRTVDNSTIWQPDYNREHYQEMYFGEGPDVESLKTYYEAQSSGRYSVTGAVSDWVQVPFNQARYGRSDGYPCPTNVCSNTWALVRDAANNWYDGQIAAGRSADDVRIGAATVRRLGSVRLRQRRELQRIRRISRPFPDRPRGRRSGRRRSDLRRGRDLVAPLEGVLPGCRPNRTGRQPRRRHADRRHGTVDRRLHDPARERWPQRLLPRVRPRPRAAGRLRHHGRR